MLRWATLAVAMTTLLSGCTASDDAPVPVLSFTEAPHAHGPGYAGFMMRADGPAVTSDHVGGHFWNATTADPTADFAKAKPCDHLPGGATMPGSWEIMCPMRPGTWYVRGHFRVTDADGTKHDYWTPEAVVTL